MHEYVYSKHEQEKQFQNDYFEIIYQIQLIAKIHKLGMSH